MEVSMALHDYSLILSYNLYKVYVNLGIRE